MIFFHMLTERWWIVWFGKFLGFTLEERYAKATDKELEWLIAHGVKGAERALLKRRLVFIGLPK